MKLVWLVGALILVGLNSIAQQPNGEKDSIALYYERFKPDTNFTIEADYEHATFVIKSWKKSIDVEIARVLGCEYYKGPINTGQVYDLKSWPDGMYLFSIKDFGKLKTIHFNYCCPRNIQAYEAAEMGPKNINLMEKPDTNSRIVHEIWTGESFMVTGPPIKSENSPDLWYPVTYDFWIYEQPEQHLKGFVRNPLLKRPLGNEY